MSGVGQSELGPVVVLGHQKGRTVEESRYHNFAMPNAAGSRKALRSMRHAQKFHMPLICLIDSPGARINSDAEEPDPAQILGLTLLTLAQLRVPTVAVLIGEGGSDSALTLGLADRMLMLEHAIYAAPGHTRDGTTRVRQIVPQELLEFGIVDEIIPEPTAGAHTDRQAVINHTVTCILRHLVELRREELPRLLHDRYARYRTIECFHDNRESVLLDSCESMLVF
ncbi:MAG: hypothetical protein NVSMB27_40690 [Ktedonobacteraceae bacterium]